MKLIRILKHVETAFFWRSLLSTPHPCLFEVSTHIIVEYSSSSLVALDGQILHCYMHNLKMNALKTKQHATKWYKSVPTAETSSESPRVVTTWNVWMSKEKQQHLLQGTSISLALAHWHATNPQAATMQNHDAGIKPPYGIFTELLGFLQLSALQEITSINRIQKRIG